MKLLRSIADQFLSFFVKTHLIGTDKGILENLLGAEALVFVDVGASGGLEPRWEPFKKVIHYIGFEPDARSARALIESPEKNNFSGYQIFETALGDRTETKSLFLTNKPTCSSLYEPNFEFLNRFPDFDRYRVVKNVDLNVESMDQALKDEKKLSIDFIKLDIQGSEHAVISGAEQILEDVLGLELEVEFLHLYKNQPLFGEISQFLEKKGLGFIDFIRLVRWERDQLRNFGQLQFADGLFLRTPEQVISSFKNGKMPIAKVMKYASILYLYTRSDLLGSLAEQLPESFPAEKRKAILAATKVLAARQNKLNLFYRISNGVLNLIHPNFGAQVLY